MTYALSVYATANSHLIAYTSRPGYEWHMTAHPWYEEGFEVPHSNQVPPVIRGPKVPLSVSQYHYKQPSIHGHPTPLPFYIFPKPSLLLRLFQQCHPNEILDKHKNKLMWQSKFFNFRRLKNNVKYFFYKQNFYK